MMHTTHFIEEFTSTLEAMRNLVIAKNADYGSREIDAFANFRNVEKLGICSVEQGIMTRISDKVSRICSLMVKGEAHVQDEKITDTLQDLANYAIILKLYLTHKTS